MLINTVPDDCLMYITSIVKVFMLSIEKKLFITYLDSRQLSVIHQKLFNVKKVVKMFKRKR